MAGSSSIPPGGIPPGGIPNLYSPSMQRQLAQPESQGVLGKLKEFFKVWVADKFEMRGNWRTANWMATGNPAMASQYGGQAFGGSVQEPAAYFADQMAAQTAQSGVGSYGQLIGGEKIRALDQEIADLTARLEKDPSKVTNDDVARLRELVTQRKATLDAAMTANGMKEGIGGAGTGAPVFADPSMGSDPSLGVGAAAAGMGALGAYEPYQNMGNPMFASGPSLDTTAIRMLGPRVNSLEGQINRLMAKGQNMTPQETAQLQTLVQKRGELMTLLSMIMQAEHDTRMSIIRNIRV